MLLPAGAWLLAYPGESVGCLRSGSCEKGGACSLQNCRARMGAMITDVTLASLHLARGRRIIPCMA